MKNKKYLLIVVFVGVLLVGCGNNEKIVKCTSSFNQNGIDYNATYEIYVDDNDYVKKVVTTEILKSDDENYLEESKESVESLYESASKEYGGYTYSVNVKGNTLNSKCTIDYTKMNVKKYVEDNPTLTNFADDKNNVKLSGVKEIYSMLGAKCEN